MNKSNTIEVQTLSLALNLAETIPAAILGRRDPFHIVPSDRPLAARIPPKTAQRLAGIQCRYYRLRKAHKIPNVREQEVSGSSSESYNMKSTRIHGWNK